VPEPIADKQVSSGPSAEGTLRLYAEIEITSPKIFLHPMVVQTVTHLGIISLHFGQNFLGAFVIGRSIGR
jgi:hypothetical protein